LAIFQQAQSRHYRLTLLFSAAFQRSIKLLLVPFARSHPGKKKEIPEEKNPRLPSVKRETQASLGNLSLSLENPSKGVDPKRRENGSMKGSKSRASPAGL